MSDKEISFGLFGTLVHAIIESNQTNQSAKIDIEYTADNNSALVIIRPRRGAKQYFRFFFDLPGTATAQMIEKCLKEIKKLK